MKLKCLKSNIFLTVLGLGMSVMLLGCQKENETVEKKDVLVEVCNPEQGDLVIMGNFMGTVTPQEEVYVIPMVNGEVLETCVKVGDEISQGAVLARLDDSAAQLQLDSANAALGTATATKKASTGGATTLQNMQTEANIETIKDNMDALLDKKETLVDAQKELKEQMDKLKDAKDEAKDAYNTAKANTKAAQVLQKDPSDKEAKKTLKKAGIKISEANPIEAVVATCQATKQATEQAYEQVKATYDQTYPALEQQYDELENSKKEIERNADSLNDNLKLAEDSYAISKGQVANETAAVYDAQINAAEVGVESAKYQQDMYTLKAPISGIVEAVQIEEHGMASAGNPAFIISNKKSMKATFKVSEEIQKTLSLGETVTVERNGVEYSGTITEIGQMVDAQSGMFVIEASVNAEGNELLTGTSVKLTVPTYKETASLLIPYDAIIYDNEVAYVYVVKEKKAVKTAIEVSLFDDTMAAVASGLTKEDVVITTYSAALSDGAGVAIKDAVEEQED